MVFGQTLLALAATLLAAWLLGALAVRLRQPRIGGEMVGGLLVGTALLSPWREEGSASEQRAVLSPEAVDAFNIAGQVGVILYLFLVGLSLDPAGVRRKARTALLVSLPVILAAVALAPLGASWFDSGRWELSTGLLAASLIMAAALMINGFPVVAHMLQERGELRGDLASTVLGAAALLTVVPFLLLLVAERVAFGSGGVEAPGLLPAGILGGFVAGVMLAGSPKARLVFQRLLGWIVPAVLVPVFLASAGERVDPRLLDGEVILGAVVFTALLLAVALPSGLVAKRVARFSAPEAKTIAALLNCRGLLLLVLAVAMADEDLIGPSLVAVLFLGALATTLMTGPLLGWAQRSTGERTITA